MESESFRVSYLDVLETLIESHVDGVFFLDVFETLIESCVDSVELGSLIIDDEEVPDDPDDLDGRHSENLGGGLEENSKSSVFSESRENLSHFSRVTKG